VNVGVGGWESEGPRLREHLERACAEYGLPPERLESLRGYRLPMRGARDRVARGRALLVGDAAGLVDPLSGDGMYEAFVSARLGAESALELLDGRAVSLEGYALRLEAALGRTLAASWKAKYALDRFPRLVYGVARLPLVWGFTSAFLRGELAHPGEAKGLVRAPLRLVDVPRPLKRRDLAADSLRRGPECGPWSRRATRRERHPPEGRAAARPPP
jgi:flavin-dependent dehydrogenase